VPDNRDKFQYGISEEIVLAEVLKVMKEHVKVIAADSERIVLVGPLCPWRCGLASKDRCGLEGDGDVGCCGSLESEE
jgi:hypothetical protein